MLSLLATRKESRVSKQHLLFDREPETWVDKVWRMVAADTRQAAVAILAEMGRATLSSRRRATEPPTGTAHES
jgi:hypothetical protein